MGIIREFKEFASRGNVIDLAVGIIIGGAFGKIVSSFVADVIMPPVGLIAGGVNFKDIKFQLSDPVLDVKGNIIKEAINLNIGNFMQAVFDFLIIALAVFIMIKAVNRFKAKEQAPPPAPPAPSREELLLTEIRDILKNK